MRGTGGREGGERKGKCDEKCEREARGEEKWRRKSGHARIESLGGTH